MMTASRMIRRRSVPKKHTSSRRKRAPPWPLSVRDGKSLGRYLKSTNPVKIVLDGVKLPKSISTAISKNKDFSQIPTLYKESQIYLNSAFKAVMAIKHFSLPDTCFVPSTKKDRKHSTVSKSSWASALALKDIALLRVKPKHHAKREYLGDILQLQDFRRSPDQRRSTAKAEESLPIKLRTKEPKGFVPMENQRQRASSLVSTSPLRGDLLV